MNTQTETTQPCPMPPTNITLTEAHRHANGRETCTGALVLDLAARVATCAECGRAWDVTRADAQKENTR